jgi:hypothetical protein
MKVLERKNFKTLYAIYLKSAIVATAKMVKLKQ